jgi:PAS domain S-box-containing protein
MDNANQLNEQLRAENNRLKRLVARLSEREMSQALSVSSSGESNNQFLSTTIGEILIGKAPFAEKIKATLQQIDAFADCQRVVLFHYNKSTRSHIVLQCSVGEPSALIPSSMSIWESIETFLQTLEHGCFELNSSNTDLPEALSPFFDNQVKSLLLFPLQGYDGPTGFLAFQESTFIREWFSFERELFKLAAIQLSEAFLRNRDNSELIKKEAINGYLLKIAETFSHNDRFEIQAHNSIEITARFFGFNRVLLFENSDSDNCYVVDEWVASNLTPLKNKFQNISYSRHLFGLNERMKNKKFLFSTDPGLNSSNDFLNAGADVARIYLPIISTNGLQGFISLEDFRHDRRWSDDEINAFIVVADLFASAFERQHAMDHMVSSHQEAIRLTRQLREKENFLENILSSVPLGILLIRNRQLLFVNKFLVEQSGISESELIGSHISSFYYQSENSDEVAEKFYHQIHRDGIGLMEVVMKNADGKPINASVMGKLCPINGFKDSYLLITQDITTLKQTQSELSETEERYRKILETTIEGVMILESADKPVFLNNAACELIGIDNNQTDGFTPSSLFVSTDDLLRYRQAFSHIAQGNDFRGDFNIKASNGLILPVDVFGSRIVLKGRSMYYLSLRNISDRKRHEAALMHSEEKFRTLSENTPDQIIRISTDGALLFVNQAFKNCYRLGASDLTGQRLFNLAQIPVVLAQSLDGGCAKAAREKCSCQIESSFTVFGQSLSIEWRISPEYGRNNDVVSFLCSGRDVTQRKLVELELRDAKEKAESADKLKSAFLANLSHEVRTPLNAIVGFSSLLKEGDTTPAEKNEFINIIVRSSDHLMALISDIIDIAKIESGVLNISKRVFSINELLKDIYLVFQKRIKLDRRSAIEQLILDIPNMAEEALLDSDPDRITQIVNNLLDNAIKFTPKGVITFGYRIEGGVFRFFVKDTGIGIEYEKLNIIFLPFRQGDESVSKKYGGTGLGLSISKKLIEALGGSIHVDSIPGEGSTFYFELPDTNIRKIPETITPNPPARGSVAVMPKSGYSWSDRILLLIDDNSSSHLHIRKLLEKTGITLISARTPASARELIKKRQSIDLVLLDMDMPEIDAVEFVKQLKQYSRDIPVIVQTKVPVNGNSASLFDAGFDEWVEKPVAREQLLQKMHLFLSRERVINKPMLD